MYVIPRVSTGGTRQCDENGGSDCDEDTEMSEAGDDGNEEDQGQGGSTSGCLGLSCGVPLIIIAHCLDAQITQSTNVHH